MQILVVDNLLLYANHIVVSHSMRAEAFQKVHQGHQAFREVVYEYPQQCGGPEFLDRYVEDYMAYLSTDYFTLQFSFQPFINSVFETVDKMPRHPPSSIIPCHSRLHHHKSNNRLQNG